MKHLILIRHAESAEKVTGMTDEARELTINGIHQAAQAGAFLRGKNNIDIMLVSTAVRASITARVIGEQLSLPPEDLVDNAELYQVSVGTLFSMIRNSDQYQTIAVVGHNPTLSYFAEFICDCVVDELRPATVLILKLDIGNWKDLQKGSAVILDRFDT